MIVSMIEYMTFPVLRFSGGMVFPALTQSELLTCTKVALKKGFFHGLEVIDSSGKLFTIRSARKLCGVGPFWGFNIFLNQRIRVELDFKSGPKQLTIEEVRSKIIKVLNGPQEWNSRGDYTELITFIEEATSVSEMVSILANAFNN